MEIEKLVRLCNSIWAVRPNDIVAVRISDGDCKGKYLIADGRLPVQGYREVIMSTAELYGWLGKVTNNYTVIQHVLHDGTFGIPDLDELDRDSQIDY